jgi:hypothetical protein
MTKFKKIMNHNMTVNPTKYGMKYKIQAKRDMIHTNKDSSSDKAIPIDYVNSYTDKNWKLSYEIQNGSSLIKRLH